LACAHGAVDARPSTIHRAGRPITKGSQPVRYSVSEVRTAARHVLTNPISPVIAGYAAGQRAKEQPKHVALLSGRDRNCNASEVTGLAGATDTALEIPGGLADQSRITNADNQLIAAAKLALSKLQLRVPRPEQLSCRLP
jgi:hypothetical protein